MTVPFRSKPENAALDAHAFAPLDEIWEYTAIPVLDMSEHLDDGTPICGQFTYADGMAALKRLGLEPLTAYDLETLHDLATRGECIELPAFTSTATAETSLAWRKVSDAANRAKEEAEERRRIVADFAADPKKREYMEGRIPLGRLGQPDDLAGAIVFLSSADAAFITGQVLSVSGGLTMHG